MDDVRDTTRYGEIEAAWLEAQIKAHWAAIPEDSDDFSCTDSTRVAREDLPEEVEAYYEAASCCGRCDTTFGPSPAGHTYLYGYNYGH